MMLGLTECDYDIAYFMKNGEWQKPDYKRIEYVPSGNDEIGREQYREYQQSNFNEYFTSTYKYALFK